MHYFRSRVKNSLKSILLFALVFGAALLVLLYYLGYYDLKSLIQILSG